MAAAYRGRGSAYSSLDQQEKALRDYDEAIRLDPRDELGYWLRAVHYDSHNQASAALQDLSEIIQHSKGNPDPNPNARYVLRSAFGMSIDIWMRDKEWHKASELTDQFISFFPKSGLGYLWKGEILSASGDRTLAMTQYTKALAFDQGDFKARILKAIQKLNSTP